jgi:hypothetical protein
LEAFWLHLLDEYVDISRRLGVAETHAHDIAA